MILVEKFYRVGETRIIEWSGEMAIEDAAQIMLNCCTNKNTKNGEDPFSVCLRMIGRQLRNGNKMTVANNFNYYSFKNIN